MERDPFRLVWRTSPSLHGAAALVMVVMGGLLVLGFDLVRLSVDGTGATLLRLAFPLPERLGGGSFVLFGGFALPSPGAAPWLLVLVPAAVGTGTAVLHLIATRVGTQVTARLRAMILERVLAARTGGHEETVQAAEFAGEAVSRENGFLGAAVIGTAQAIGIVALSLIYVMSLDLRLAFATAGLLLLGGLLGLRRLRLRGRAVQSLRIEARGVRGSLADLLRRRPALHAHGTAAFESLRLLSEWDERHRPVERAERRLGLVQSAAAAVLLLTPLAVLALGAGGGRLSPGGFVSAATAAALAALAVGELTRWQRALDRVAALFADLARALGGLQARERPRSEKPGAARADGNPASAGGGARILRAEGVSAYDPESGARISGIDAAIPLPAHVAVLSDAEEAGRLLAAVLAGQVEPSTGRLTYGGVSLAALAPAARARRVAYAGGATVLIAGSLRDNLLYGSTGMEVGRDNLLYGSSGTEPGLDDRLATATGVAGLEGAIHARGLEGTLDPGRESRLATAIVEARHAVQAALRSERLDRFVDPFDTARYNNHATVGENLLFGQPVGDSFREGHLAGHPFVRAVLEAADLTKPLTAMGLSIASSMVEIFADIPAGHPVFERFSFFPASERGAFEDLLERRAEPRGGRRRFENARDRERLIGLALRYNESRHRLGLLDEGLQARILAARVDFARMLPASLRPAIEFYDPARLCKAASVQDNLLFGRVAEDQAGAEAAVHRVIRRVLTEADLDTEVSRIGLECPVDPAENDFSSAELAAIDLVRCLVREPDVIVVEGALSGLSDADAEALVARLRAHQAGRGLVLAASALSPGMDTPPFDMVLALRRGALQVEERGFAGAMGEEGAGGATGGDRDDRADGIGGQSLAAPRERRLA
jgi:ABC-type multidrug transport system fused ATPase/permease subunit